MSEIIKVENLVKRYKELIALDHLNLNIMEGEVFGLLGPNGSGKSTAINCMLSLLQYDGGEVTIMGKKMTPASYDIKSKIGVVPQDMAVYEELTVRENIDFFCGLYIKDKATRKQYVDEAIEFVGIKEFENFRPKKLSGGLKRRLNIACGIAHKPKIIFFDEPTVAVDPQSRNKILEGILELNKNGATIIYTSHYMEEIEQLCTRLSILDKGQVIASGTIPEIKRMIKKNEIVTAEVIGLDPKVVDTLKMDNDVLTANYQGKTLKVEAAGKSNIVKVMSLLEKEGYEVQQIYSVQPSLNDVFLELTGKQLRDEG
ncbi:MAG: ABC transporter ATP-binding protein [Saccharofermentans sp.]|nr:ABC transporter ATP-binding protein [Saccharofermentans sp.]